MIINRAGLIEEFGSLTKAAAAFGIAKTTLTDRLVSYTWVYFDEDHQTDGTAYKPKETDEHGLITEKRSNLCDENGNIIKYWDKKRQPRKRPEQTLWVPGSGSISKVATLLDHEGNVTSQWISENPKEAAKKQVWEEIASAFLEIIPHEEPTSYTHANVAQDLLTVLPVGDHHFGMMSWHKETGDDYDLDIAERLFRNAFAYLIDAAPNSCECLIPLLGDLLHTDSFDAVTPAHHNLLDADSRYPKIVQTVIRAIRVVVRMAKKKFPKVHLIVEIGNHDPSSAVFLAQCLDALYEEDDQVSVDTSPSHYHYYRFGKCLLATHHGHGAKMEKLPLIMATDRPEDWGATKHRLWMTGHIHHAKSVDFVGCTVESFRILAAPDAYAAQKGHRSTRDMKALVFHREYGEVGRQIVTPEMML